MTIETWVLVIWLATGTITIPDYTSVERCEQAIEHIFSKEPWKSQKEQIIQLAYIDCVPGPMKESEEN